MATYAKYRRAVFDLLGNAIPGATVTVIDEATGLNATLFSTRTGTGKSNPFTSDATTGVVEFYCVGGAYSIRVQKGTDYDETFRYEANGTFAEHDFDTGAEAFPVGAVGAPSIYFDGDATTGLYAPSVGTMAVTVGGVQKQSWASTLISLGVAAVITSNAAAAFAVGRQGATSPQFQVDAATASVATGVKITGAAAGAGVSLTAISSGTNENLAFAAKGSGVLNFNSQCFLSVNSNTQYVLEDITNTNAGSSASSLLTLGNSTGVGQAGMQLNSAANVSLGGASSLNISNFAFAPLTFCTNGTVRLTIAAGGGITIPGALSLTAGTASTSPTTGTLVVTGGVGISGTLWQSVADGSTNVVFAGTTKALRIGHSAAGTIFEGVDNTGIASYQALYIGGSTLNYQIGGADALTINASKVVAFLANVASTSTTTGTCVVTGGVGISGALYVGNNIIATASAPTFTAIGSTTTQFDGPKFTFYHSASTMGNQAGAAFFIGQWDSAGTAAQGYFDLYQSNYLGGFVQTLMRYRMFDDTWEYYTGGTLRKSILSTGEVNTIGFYSSHATQGIGYTTGAGGTVTQATSKATAVILNKVTGAITTHNAALAAATIVTFVFTNSAIGATDQIECTHESGGTLGAYSLNGRATGAGTGAIDIRNNTAGSLSEALVIRFSIKKSVNA